MSEQQRGAGEPRQGIQSVEIAARVLFALETGGAPMSLNDIARACDSQPSKIHRYLVSLGRVGLTAQSPTTNLYDLGPAMRRLGGESLRRTNDVALISEHTPKLRDETGHSINLAVWSDEGPVIVRWDYGTHALPLTARLGAILPILASSAGHVYLAYLPEKMTEKAVGINRESAPSLPGSRKDLQEIRQSVRSLGYAETSGAVIRGISSISVPIFSAGDPMPVVATLVLPHENVKPAERAHNRAKLIEMARLVSADLGEPGESGKRREPGEPGVSGRSAKV
ncbi:IclR family transcriptional regulator [Subtercola lobariae]|uniref:IclR family transcriptional regulator n=1 Tax=Subtercola lobariae TaxID=1588641 RepID=A0A917EXQ5_9MICO|nr:IclR family transcriptional regulator [Subtercola lobariae]GGF21720.1 hypothetical protein GCM10011399_14300 [Subtercola lobariae]